MGPMNATLTVGGKTYEIRGFMIFDRASHRVMRGEAQRRAGPPLSFTCMVIWQENLTIMVTHTVNPSPADPGVSFEHQLRINLPRQGVNLSTTYFTLVDSEGIQPVNFTLSGKLPNGYFNLTGTVVMFWPEKWVIGKGTWWNPDAYFAWGRAFSKWKARAATVTLTVKISKIGKEEGELTVTYGDKEEKVKIKVIGLKPRHPRKPPEQELGGSEETNSEEATGEETGEGPSETQQEGTQLQSMNIIIHADITFSGQASRIVYEGTTYNSSFTTHYVYSFSLKLYKKTTTSTGVVYEGTLKLLDVSVACSHKYYHQIARRGDVVAEAKVKIDGCINRMPEDQSLETSVEIVVDSQGRIVDMDVGYGDWILGELTGTSISTVKGEGKEYTATTKVTKELVITTIPLEVLIRATKPKIGDVTAGQAETNTDEYPSLFGQFFAVDSSEPIPIEIQGTIAISNP